MHREEPKEVIDYRMFGILLMVGSLIWGGLAYAGSENWIFYTILFVLCYVVGVGSLFKHMNEKKARSKN
ncbi:hypothetical protein [Metabacillus iocasae]|uniref:Uncharacterized protein n=1 Tax=Priestia iocasae TaxID=2291674 RepID=A0ABS2QUT6_9BACI|nr:hypothetical protein [Metabacillus iocasae]MBM7703043.1 hypothetical protein [Metabacillus iocasae]